MGRCCTTNLKKKARLTFLTKEDAVGKSLMENKDFSKKYYSQSLQN